MGWLFDFEVVSNCFGASKTILPIRLFIMKKTPKVRASRRTSKSFLAACALAVLSLLPGELKAGLININFTNTFPSGLFSDGPGILGAGAWNRVAFSDAANTNILLDNDSILTPVSISQSSGTAVTGRSQGNGNRVQEQSWTDGSAFILTLTGLMPSHIYKVALYSDRVGSGASDDTYIVGGVGVTLSNPGAAPTDQPGVSGVDYGIFVANSTSSGQMSLAVPGAIAGLQIIGVFRSSETGPKMDGMITKSSTSLTGKKEGRYKSKPDKSQTVTQKVKKNKTLKYYVNVKNDGPEIDNCLLIGSWRSNQFKKIKVRDRANGANATAKTLAGTHTFPLDAGQTAQFVVKAKRKPNRTGEVSFTICASPSTKTRSQQDCVTGTLK